MKSFREIVELGKFYQIGAKLYVIVYDHIYFYYDGEIIATMNNRIKWLKKDTPEYIKKECRSLVNRCKELYKEDSTH